MKKFSIFLAMLILTVTSAQARLRKSLTCELTNKKELGYQLKIDTKEGWYTITDKKGKEIEKADNTSSELVRRSDNSIQFNTLNSMEGGGPDQILLGVHIQTTGGVEKTVAFHHKRKEYYNCN